MVKTNHETKVTDVRNVGQTDPTIRCRCKILKTIEPNIKLKLSFIYSAVTYIAMHILGQAKFWQYIEGIKYIKNIYKANST